MNDNLHQYSCLENSIDRGAWQGTIHGFTKSQTGLHFSKLVGLSSGVIYLYTHIQTHTHTYIYIHTYFLFILFMVFLGKNTRMVLLQWTTLSEVFTITYPSWAVLQSMAQCFIELHKPLCQKKAVIHEGDRFSMQIFLLNMGGLHPINQFSSVAHLCLTFCYPMDCSTTGFPVHYQLPELAQSESEK